MSTTLNRWTMPLVALLATACRSSSVLAPTEEPCVVPASLPAVEASGMTQASLRSALLHAAGPMTSSLGTGIDVRALQSGIGELTATAPVSADMACHGIMAATKALDALPNDPATRPDRDGIRLVLSMAVKAFDVQGTARGSVVAD